MRVPLRPSVKRQLGSGASGSGAIGPLLPWEHGEVRRRLEPSSVPESGIASGDTFDQGQLEMALFGHQQPDESERRAEMAQQDEDKGSTTKSVDKADDGGGSEPAGPFDQDVADGSASDSSDGAVAESAPVTTVPEPGSGPTTVESGDGNDEEPSTSVDIIIFRLSELIDPDQFEPDIRNTKLRDIQREAGNLSELELGVLAQSLIGIKEKFEPRTFHFTVKCLVARHPVVLAQPEPLPSNVLGGIARKLIAGEYTWDSLVVQPPRSRPAPNPASVTTVPEPQPASVSTDGGDGGGDEPQSNASSVDDSILATLQRQNAQMAALGF